MSWNRLYWYCIVASLPLATSMNGHSVSTRLVHSQLLLDALHLPLLLPQQLCLRADGMRPAIRPPGMAGS